MPAYEYYVNPTDYDGDNYNGAARTPTGGEPANHWYLPLKVYLPDTPGEYPVIVFSHGFQGDYRGAEDLANGYGTIEGLTAAGYIVIAPTHADSATSDPPTYDPLYSAAPAGYAGTTTTDAAAFAFRADDIALAINFLQLEAGSDLNAPDGAGLPEGSPTGYSIDLSAPIVVVGHSYGSNTVAVAAGAELRDGSGYLAGFDPNTDIGAVVSLSGTGIGGATIFNAGSFDGTVGAITQPYLRLSGSDDLTVDVVDVGDRYEPYFLTEEDRSSTTWAVDIDGATHAQFAKPDGDKDGTVTAAEEARFAAILDAIINFADYYVRGDGAALTALEAVDLDDPTHYDLNGGSETVTLTSGDDLYFGYDGNDTITGSDGDDQLYGMDGDDSLFGGADNDLLAGGPGNDALTGGYGDDTYFVDSAGDVVVDVSIPPGVPTDGGFDTVYAGVNYVLGYFLDKLVLTGEGDITGDGYGNNNSVKSDIIVGNEGDNTLRGWGGEDSLDGGRGDDTVIGGAHDDTIVGGAGTDSIEGGDGQDEIDGGAGNDSLYGGAGYDIIIEYETPDGGYDYVEGGDGRDLINAGVAHDVVYGGDDNDTINEAGAGNDTLHGDAGDDIITGDGDGDTEGGEDSLSGGDGADTLNGRYGEDTLDGGAGNDSLLGGDGADDLFGGADADTLQADAGDDTLDGGTGNDSLVGGAGDDDFYVDSTADVVLEASGEGHDRVLASASYTLSAQVEELVLYGSAVDAVGNTGENTIWGNANANLIIGGYGDDTLTGGDGDDEIYSGGDDDLIFGSDDNDSLTGGTGADTLDGGEGVDRLTGGFGDDVFTFASPAEIGLSLGARDVITDFNNTAEDDLINLAVIDAVTGGSDNPFTFIGTAAFSNTAGELRYTTLLGTTFVMGDVDGDGAADFTLQLSGVLTLTSADFVL